MLWVACCLSEQLKWDVSQDSELIVAFSLPHCPKS